MTAFVSTMRSMIVPPTGVYEPRHQSACGSVVGALAGPAVNRPWALDADGMAGITATIPPRHLGRRST